MFLKVAARGSALSRAQAQEVLKEIQAIHPFVRFEETFVLTTGDRDQKTSLRVLEKTDFFTKEIDDLLLSRTCRIAIHSAKDLPDPIPTGLSIIALTHGVDSSDSLVLRQGETLQSLAPGARIATSSQRREEAVLQMRSDLTFRDVRGTIEQRLHLLHTGEADGVVIAEAALIRLGLTHLNRLRIPGETVPLQGKLAIIARSDDPEMRQLFQPIDSRCASI